MNLKEAFRYQNKLQALLDEAQGILDCDSNVTNVANTYLRHKVMAEAEDETILDLPQTEYAQQITDIARFMLYLLEEKGRLFAAIRKAKDALDMDMDSEVSLNAARQSVARTFKRMNDLRSSEQLLSGGGTGYRFNAEGNQISYCCDVKRVTTINYDRKVIHAALGNYMNTAELQAGRGEPLRDTARVLGRYYDCAVWRTYRQRDLEELAELSGIPVINGLTDYAHPCQVLADLMTIRERRGTLAGLKLCFVGDGSNMANSLIVGGLLAGMQVSCVCPPGYRPAADVLMFAHKYGNAFHLTTDPAEGLRDADIVATAAWNTTAPGTAESEQRLRDFVGFQLTGRLLENAKPNALVLHCLPAHRGEEISTALFEQHADEIFDEAENRLHVQKAVLAVLLAGK